MPGDDQGKNVDTITRCCLIDGSSKRVGEERNRKKTGGERFEALRIRKKMVKAVEIRFGGDGSWDEQRKIRLMQASKLNVTSDDNATKPANNSRRNRNLFRQNRAPRARAALQRRVACNGSRWNLRRGTMSEDYKCKMRSASALYYFGFHRRLLEL